MQEEQFTDLEQPSEEELNSIQQEYDMIKKQQSEIQQLQKLQQQITQQIDTEIIKYFTYFIQFFKKHQQKDVVTLDTEQTITANKTFNQITASKIIKTDGTGSQILLANGQTANIGDFLPVQHPHAHGSLTLEPNINLREGIRIMKNKSNWNSFVFTGCNEDIENDDGIWVCGSSSSEFRIQKFPDSYSNFKGLVIDFECEKLMFNQYQLYPPIIPPEPDPVYSDRIILEYQTGNTHGWGDVRYRDGLVTFNIGIKHTLGTTVEGSYIIANLPEHRPHFKRQGSSITVGSVQMTCTLAWNNLCYATSCSINGYGDIYVNPSSAGHTFLQSYCDVAISGSFFDYNWTYSI